MGEGCGELDIFWGAVKVDRAQALLVGQRVRHY
jgi:hypothetical protein